ncbi:MAG: DUF4932 domain-containing protein [Planctomycetota bacterium]
MRTALIVLAAGLALGAAKAPEIDVRVDPRVELLSVIFRLAGSPEYSKGRVPGYTAAVDAHFGPHREHAVVALARDLRAKRGISYDAVAGMAVHLDDAASLTPVVPLDPWPASLDRRWTKEDAERFLAAARDFAKKTEFAEFVAERDALYRETESRLCALLEKDAGFEWFDGFFGGKPGRKFTLIPALLNGGMCYGPRVEKDGKEEIFSVLGVWKIDAAGKPVFDRDMLAIIAHEFCHSFVNPFVEKYRGALVPPAERLWPTVAEAMKRQAYGDAEILVKESLVRAAVILYLERTQGEEAAKKEARQQTRLSFTWVPRLAALLAGPAEGKGLDGRVPEIAAFFEAEAKRADAVPRVVAMTPPNGATDVDPSLAEIRITFDRPMDRSRWSFVGGGPTFPTTRGPAAWSVDGKTITLPVKLVPGHRYEFRLNRGRRFRGFRSAEGVPLPSVPVTFTTK